MDKTARKALRMLELFSASSAPRGVSELARELALPKSNIHRLLKTLEDMGYLRQTPEKTYALTLKLWQLGATTMSRIDAKSVAPEHMQRLVKATRESALLAVLDGFDAVYIDKVESDQAIQATTRVGSRVPAHCVGTGKAMLSYQSPDFLAAMLRKARPHTPATAFQADILLEQLRQARARGYAVNRAEFRVGVSGVGAAILDKDGRAVAAIGVWGPDERIAPMIERHGRHVMRCAADISRELGFTGSLTQSTGVLRTKTRVVREKV